MDLCAHFGVCGGCSWQDVSYEEQLKRKQATVVQALEGLPVPEVSPILGSPDVWYYRNKMEFSFGTEKSEVVLGLKKRNMYHTVVDVTDCRLLSAESNQVLEEVRRWAKDHGLMAHHPNTGQGVLRHLVVREGKNTGQRLVNLIAQTDSLPLEDLAKRLGKRADTLLISQTQSVSDVARGEIQVLTGSGAITEKTGRLSFKVSPYSFFQTNTRGTEVLHETLRRMAGDMKNARVLDLYCGTGALGLALAGQSASVLGIDSEPEAIRDAQENARANGVSNAEYLCGVPEERLPELANTFDIAIVDPPRSGLHKKALKTLLSLKIPYLLLVSCNPKSLSQDLKKAAEFYKIDEIQPLDLFPHTPHVESVVKLTLRPPSE